MLNELLTALAPILDDTVIKTKGLGMFKVKDGVTTVVKEKPVADYEPIAITQPKTGYLRIDGDLTQVSSQKITCDATVFRLRAAISYVVAFTEETKDSIFKHMVYKIGAVPNATVVRAVIEKSKILGEEFIPQNTYEFAKMIFNVEFNYATNGECPTELVCAC